MRWCGLAPVRSAGLVALAGAAAAVFASAVLAPSLASATKLRNGLVAYTTGNGEEEPFAIWTIKPDGTGNRRLLHADSHFQSGPSNPRWSRDGTRLLFFRGLNRDVPDLGSLWYLTLATKKSRRVPLPTGRGVISGYDWAPDGRHLVVSLRKDWDRAMLYTLRLNGTGLKKLRPGLYPSWSGDGRHIVFTLMRRRRGQPWASTVNVVRPNGTGFRRLSAASANDDWSPGFSPGGTRVLYVNTNAPALGPTCCGMEWRRVDVTGRHNVLVKSLPGQSDFIDWCGPQWTPDGRRLAVMRTEHPFTPDTRTALVTFNLSGQDEREAFAIPRRRGTPSSGCGFSWQRVR
jgi:Tol biopolymer transport system component